MKTPIVYEIVGNLRCLLVEDGQKITIGRAAECDVQIIGEDVHDVEASAKFVNDCHSVVVSSTDGGAAHEQLLPSTFPVAGFDLVLYRPSGPAEGAKEGAEREITLQGLAPDRLHLVLKSGRPLLLGSSADCDVVITSADCPAVQMALWAAVDNKVVVQVLDNSSVVDWLGRGNATEAEMELPVSLSLGGKMILIDNGAESYSLPSSAPVPIIPAGPRILSKSAPPRIVADEFYINSNSQQHGPFSEEEVRRLVRIGTYSAHDLAWKEGAEDWVPLNKLIRISGPPHLQQSLCEKTQSVASANGVEDASHFLSLEPLPSTNPWIPHWITGTLIFVAGLFALASSQGEPSLPTSIYILSALQICSGIVTARYGVNSPGLFLAAAFALPALGVLQGIGIINFTSVSIVLVVAVSILVFTTPMLYFMGWSFGVLFLALPVLLIFEYFGMKIEAVTSLIVRVAMGVSLLMLFVIRKDLKRFVIGIASGQSVGLGVIGMIWFRILMSGNIMDALTAPALILFLSTLLGLIYQYKMSWVADRTQALWQWLFLRCQTILKSCSKDSVTLTARTQAAARAIRWTQIYAKPIAIPLCTLGLLAWMMLGIGDRRLPLHFSESINNLTQIANKYKKAKDEVDLFLDAGSGQVNAIYENVPDSGDKVSLTREGERMQASLANPLRLREFRDELKQALKRNADLESPRLSKMPAEYRDYAAYIVFSKSLREVSTQGLPKDLKRAVSNTASGLEEISMIFDEFDKLRQAAENKDIQGILKFDEWTTEYGGDRLVAAILRANVAMGDFEKIAAKYGIDF